MGTKIHGQRKHVAALLIALSSLTACLVHAAPAAAEPAVAAPGPKAKSPLTNLGAYPKLTSAQLDENVAKERRERTTGSRESASTTELTSTETLADGRLRVDHYMLAPGADPARVADSLRKQGRKNVRLVQHDPAPSTGSDIGIAGPDDCAYGAARAKTCPNSWWSNLGRHNPVVLFNDHSSALWPTNNAVYKWNQTPNIDSWYTWNNCNGNATHCVDVWSANYGETGLIGEVTIYYIPPFHGRMIDAVVRLNDWYQPTYFTRNSVVTHELGHVLGLGHNEWSGDVMYWAANRREDIGGENPALLRNIYSIDRA